MSGLPGLFTNNLLPIFLIAGAGFWFARKLAINPRPLSQVVFYLFSPCLIFDLLVHSALQGQDLARMAGVAVLLILGIGLAAWGASRLLRFERSVRSAVTITAMFMNAGNFGLPVILFAFQEEALANASVFFVASVILTFTLGVFIASLGTARPRQALINLLKLPTLYALVLALLFRGLGWSLPLPLDRAVSLLSDATIPIMLVLLGMQLNQVSWSVRWAPVAVASGLRLLASPALALLLSAAFGLPGAAHQAAVLQAAMPAAILNTVLAAEYNLQPALVTAVVVLTTLLSPLSLTPLLAYLGG